MMMRKANVSLPLNAAEKFREAAYFFNLMVRDQQKTLSVPYLFSAFLTSLNSVVDLLLRQNNGHPAFQSWFAEQMSKKRDDSIMSGLYALRNVTVHNKPIDTISYDSAPRFGVEYLEGSHIEFGNWTDDEGTERWNYKVGKDGTTVECGTSIRWYFAHDGTQLDLMDSCHHGLQFIEGVLRDWEKVQAGANGTSSGS